jgi:hypothetical protein
MRLHQLRLCSRTLGTSKKAPIRGSTRHETRLQKKGSGRKEVQLAANKMDDTLPVRSGSGGRRSGWKMGEGGRGAFG